ncbi:MAG: DUF3352 domain-containing protein [Bacteroidia bacterium]|nr:DUF3352 domain-containing protein [Bacteroidia bacterium]
MTRAVNYSLIIILVLASIVATIYFYNKYSSGLTGNALNAMPASAGFYLKSEIKQGKMSAITKQPVWKLVQLLIDNRAEQAFARLDSLLKNESIIPETDNQFYISVHPVSADRFDLLLLSGMPVSSRRETALKILELWSSGNLKTSKRQYEGVTIYECSGTDFAFTFGISKNVFIGSSTPFLVEDAIRQQKAATGRLFKLSLLTDAFMKKEKKPTSTVHLHLESAGALAQVFLNKEFAAKANSALMGSVAEFKVEDQANHFLMTGYTASEDSTQLAAFIAMQKPVKPSAIEALPASTAWFRWVGFENSQILKRFFSADEVFIKANEKVKKQTGLIPSDTLFHYLTGEFISLLLRPASVKFESNRLTILKLKEPAKAEALLDKLNRRAESAAPVEMYNQSKIKQVKLRFFSEALTGSWAKAASATYYMVKGNYLVMASSASAMRTFIDEYQSNQLLVKQKSFTEHRGFLREQNNLLFYYRMAESNYYLKALLNEKYESFFEKNSNFIQQWNAMAWQMTGSNVSCETRFALFYEPQNKLPSIELIASEKTDTTVSSGILPVNTSTESFALLQDDEGQLYKFNSSGSLVWKNLMPGKIISPFYAADIYRNSRQQIIFNTAEQLIAIDTDGDFISNFPIILPASATGPLLKVPFNQGTREALLIPSANGRIYAYQPNGRIYGAWSFTYVEPVELITHGMFSQRDYLAMHTVSGKIIITAANGSMLWQSSASYALAGVNKKLFTDTVNNQFVFCTENGTVNKINEDGKTESKAFLNETVNDFLMDDFDRDRKADFLFLTTSQVVAYSQQGRKIFSYDFKKEKIPDQMSSFAAGQKVYVLCHSQEQNLTWVFEKKTGHYPKSPVRGGLSGFIADMNSDGRTQLVTASSDGFLYFYVLN